MPNQNPEPASQDEKGHRPQTPATLPALVSEVEELDGGTKGLFSWTAGVVRAEIPVAVFRRNLASLTQTVLDVFQDVAAVGKFRLKEVTLQVEVSAEGGVQLIGTGKVGGKGSITLTFME